MPVKKQIKSKRNKIKDLKTTRAAIIILQQGQYSWTTEDDDKVENTRLGDIK